MRTANEEARRAKEIEIMETCFDCYAENGFTSVGIKAIAKACGCSVSSLYQYFDNLDDLIVQSTEYCMTKVEDEFMAQARPEVKELWRVVDE
ncbi:MAG: TetR/AcrR family transcriptional regulator, partial [Gemmiger sp.]